MRSASCLGDGTNFQTVVLVTTFVAGALACGCADGDPSQIGADELFRVRDAQFVRAPLPGKAPAKGGAVIGASAGSGGPPRVTALMSLNNVVVQGQAGKQFSGRASRSGVALAVALEGVSNGYWVLPLGTLDPPTQELTWSMVSDFDVGIRPGLHDLLVTAVSAHGVAGQQVALTGLCVDGRIPDNLRICNPKRPLPKAVISLQWDANADLDLQVVTPDGQVVDSKHPITATMLDDTGMLPDDAGAIDRDSNAGCAIDGIRGEDLVWIDVKPSGRYAIYANLFDSCKQPAVRFRVAIYTAVDDADGGEHLQQWFARGGELLELSANAGTARGLFVTEFNFD
jgi:hypothetical protein